MEVSFRPEVAAAVDAASLRNAASLRILAAAAVAFVVVFRRLVLPVGPLECFSLQAWAQSVFRRSTQKSALHPRAGPPLGGVPVATSASSLTNFAHRRGDPESKTTDGDIERASQKRSVDRERPEAASAAVKAWAARSAAMDAAAGDNLHHCKRDFPEKAHPSWRPSLLNGTCVSAGRKMRWEEAMSGPLRRRRRLCSNCRGHKTQNERTRLLERKCGPRTRVLEIIACLSLSVSWHRCSGFALSFNPHL